MTRKAMKGQVGSGNKVPVWIVSFSDMITLLLAFFVLLQAFAKTRDPELFFQGQGSFRRAIAGLGMPSLFLGKRKEPGFDYRKQKHSTEEDTAQITRGRVIDPDSEKIRVLFAELQKIVETKSSESLEKPIDVMDTPIRFAKGQHGLETAAKDYLSELATSFKENLSGTDFKIYVVGLSSEDTSPEKAWILSSLRARSVEEYLREKLSSGGRQIQPEIHSWGNGSEGEWFRTFGLDPKDSFIMIAIMTRR